MNVNGEELSKLSHAGNASLWTTIDITSEIINGEEIVTTEYGALYWDHEADKIVPVLSYNRADYYVPKKVKSSIPLLIFILG